VKHLQLTYGHSSLPDAVEFSKIERFLFFCVKSFWQKMNCFLICFMAILDPLTAAKEQISISIILESL